MSRLAVLAPHVGSRSETFIRRHMEELAPGRTVVVATSCDGFYGAHWTVDAPMLLLSRMRQPSRVERFVRSRLARFGLERDASAAAVGRFLRRHDVSVALGEYLDWSLQWLDVLQRAGIRCYAHAHGYDVSMQLRDPQWRQRYREYDRADGVIAMSAAAGRRLVELGLSPSKVHVIPYGVDLPPEPIERPGRPPLRCVAVGRMVAKKAPLLTLEAFRLAARGPRRMRLDMIGEGDLLPAAREFVRAHGLEADVALHGGQPSDVVRQRLREADLFLQHSITDPDTGDEEGLPVAILEAMAHALPVVATRHAGIPEAVVEGKTGVLVDEGDTAAMADAIAGLAADADARRSLGRAGWRRARARFTWERERDALRQLLHIGHAPRRVRLPALSPEAA